MLKRVSALFLLVGVGCGDFVKTVLEGGDTDSQPSDTNTDSATSVAPVGGGTGTRTGGSTGTGTGTGTITGGSAGTGTGNGTSVKVNLGGCLGEVTQLANLDVSGEGGTVDADLAIDPNAGGGLLDADLTATSGSTTTIESTADAELGTSDAPAEGEAAAGLEADVEGAGSGDDVSTDPADGLTGGLL